MSFGIANDAAADQVLDEHPFAPLIGMLLDQQYGMEHAFRGPWKVLTRFGTLDATAIAEANPEEFTALCSTPPAIHRYPAAMAARLQDLARVIPGGIAKVEGVVRTETLISFQVYSRHDLERLFSIGFEE